MAPTLFHLDPDVRVCYTNGMTTASVQSVQAQSSSLRDLPPHLQPARARQMVSMRRKRFVSCALCGSLFHAVSVARYCSARCRVAAYRSRLAGAVKLMGDDPKVLQDVEI